MSDFKLIDKLFDQTMVGLQKNLDLRLKRNMAINSNITNAETPGYRAVDLNFGRELDRAFERSSSSLKTTSGKHLDMTNNSQSHFVPDFTGPTKGDGNNVDIDIQMGKLTSNAGKYQTSASLVRKKLHMLRTAIRFAMR